MRVFPTGWNDPRCRKKFTHNKWLSPDSGRCSSFEEAKPNRAVKRDCLCWTGETDRQEPTWSHTAERFLFVKHSTKHGWSSVRVWDVIKLMMYGCPHIWQNNWSEDRAVIVHMWSYIISPSELICYSDQECISMMSHLLAALFLELSTPSSLLSLFFSSSFFFNSFCLLMIFSLCFKVLLFLTEVTLLYLR